MSHKESDFDTKNYVHVKNQAILEKLSWYETFLFHTRTHTLFLYFPHQEALIIFFHPFP